MPRASRRPGARIADGEPFAVPAVEIGQDDGEADVPRWMTLSEIAHDRRISLDTARRLVEASNCPKVFRSEGTVYLL